MALKSRIPVIAAELEPLTREALHAGAMLVAQRAKDRVVIGVRDPHLHDAIDVRSEPEGEYVVAGNNEVFWGHFVEHGTSHSAPEPFLVPALEETRKEVLGLVAAALRRSR